MKPTITPIIWRLVEAILKMAKPNMMVLRGTNEFSIEATALSISVSAIAKKKAGKKEPRRPERSNHFHFDLGTFFKW